MIKILLFYLHHTQHKVIAFCNIAFLKGIIILMINRSGFVAPKELPNWVMMCRVLSDSSALLCPLHS